MKHIVLIILIVCIAFGCRKSSRPDKPKNLLSKEKMASVIYDMFVVNSAKGVNRKLLENNGVHPERFVLEKHQIDSAQFANSNTYYAYSIEDYKSIIENVEAKIEKEKAKYQSIIDSEDSLKKKTRDSIRAARKANPNKLKKLEKQKADSSQAKEIQAIKADSTVLKN